MEKTLESVIRQVREGGKKKLLQNQLFCRCKVKHTFAGMLAAL